MRRLMGEAGEKVMPLLFDLQQADLRAQSTYKREEKLAKLAAGKRCYEEIVAAGDPVTIKDLAISGSDLIALGMQPGPQLGEMLKRLLEIVLERPQDNTAQELKKIALNWIKKK